MKRVLLLPLLSLVLFSCSGSRTYVINGTLEDEKYNGEYVFLLPLDGVMPRIIDSVQVKDRSFIFTGKTDSAQVKIIRMRHLLRLDIQELLVVVEPGNIWVRLDTVSAAGGTPQNEKLQDWKEVKMQADETMNLLRRMSQTDVDQETAARIAEQWEKVQTDFKEYSRIFIDENQGTAVGRFVRDMTGAGQ
ncbi:MAG: DUF4369 domain-containing protein [Bacteroidales bacterium]|jgi:hypothetical protein|nr:DUF4369 domain-containing protein [Bacteroidales bacterium]NLH24165.1 DUF4369 domain-containing protein [Bacteroidales bacterium]HPJ82832.1 DUF4369 domain-containing protein [Bacteroidales bacterium]